MQDLLYSLIDYQYKTFNFPYETSSNTDAIHVPSGTTAQRPGSPAAGYFRYNSTTGDFEGYTDSWGAIAGGGGTNIAVNVDASGSSVEGDDVRSREFGALIGAAIQAEIVSQKRPGGLLA